MKYSNTPPAQIKHEGASEVTHGCRRKPKPNRLSPCSWRLKGSEQLENHNAASATHVNYIKATSCPRAKLRTALPFLCIPGVKAQPCRYVLPVSQHGKNAASLTRGPVLTIYQHDGEGTHCCCHGSEQQLPLTLQVACRHPIRRPSAQDSCWAHPSCKTAVTGSPHEWQLKDCVWFMSK